MTTLQRSPSTVFSELLLRSQSEGFLVTYFKDTLNTYSCDFNGDYIYCKIYLIIVEGENVTDHKEWARNIAQYKPVKSG